MGAFISTLMGVQITVILKAATCNTHSDVAHRSPSENPSCGRKSPPVKGYICRDICYSIKWRGSKKARQKSQAGWTQTERLSLGWSESSKLWVSAADAEGMGEASEGLSHEQKNKRRAKYYLWFNLIWVKREG